MNVSAALTAREDNEAECVACKEKKFGMKQCRFCNNLYDIDTGDNKKLSLSLSCEKAISQSANYFFFYPHVPIPPAGGIQIGGKQTTRKLNKKTTRKVNKKNSRKFKKRIMKGTRKLRKTRKI